VYKIPPLYAGKELDVVTSLLLVEVVLGVQVFKFIVDTVFEVPVAQVVEAVYIVIVPVFPETEKYTEVPFVDPT